jgi:peptide-methionine (S)-S-oxide reductase
MKREVVTLGGGCFWCLEAVYRDLEGVQSVESGYMGGHLADPSYRDVCTGRTGHAEVTQIAFDADVLSFRELLEVFFAIHDPTTRDRQGNDVGSQYRSVIFHHNGVQRTEAEEFIRELEKAGRFAAPIVTQVESAGEFYKAEDYHQEYFQNNPNQPYCQLVVAPKVGKFREKFGAKLKSGSAGGA